MSSRTTGQREALADSNFYIDVVRVLAISAQSRSGGDDVCITIEMGSVKEKGGKKRKRYLVLILSNTFTAASWRH